jgi:hypothetical protein
VATEPAVVVALTPAAALGAGLGSVFGSVFGTVIWAPRDRIGRCVAAPGATVAYVGLPINPGAAAASRLGGP